MSIAFSLERAPINAALKEACGLPWGCVVQPFADLEENKALSLFDIPTVSSKDVSRCRSCSAYINGNCNFERSGWICSLCTGYNEFTAHDIKYARPGTRRSLPELRDGAVEMFHPVVEGDEEHEDLEEGEGPPGPYDFPEARPSVLLLIDRCGGPDFLSAVAGAATAALEAAPGAMLCGVAAFGPDLEVFDVRQGGHPRTFNLSDDPEPTLPPCLGPEPADVLPLEALLQPVASCRQRLVQALESIKPAAAGAPRRFGASVQALLRLVGISGAAVRIKEGEGLEPASDSASRASAAAVAGPPSPAIPAAAGAPHAPPSFVVPPSTAAHGPGDAHGLPVAASVHEVMVSVAGLRIFVFLSGAPGGGRGGLQPHPPKTSASAELARRVAQLGLRTAPARSQPAVPLPPPPPSAEMFLDGVAVAIDMPLTAAPAAQAGPQKERAEVDPEGKAFYSEAGIAAASIGVSVDLFLMPGPNHLGLDALSPIATTTGGLALLYRAEDPADSTLTQDIIHRLGVRRAVACMLRIRTGPEFRVGRVYGHVTQDGQFEDLYHAGSCDPHGAFTFDFEYATGEGFANRVGTGPFGNPAIQVAFAYSVVTPVHERPPLPVQTGFAAQASPAGGSGLVSRELSATQGHEGASQAQNDASSPLPMAMPLGPAPGAPASTGPPAPRRVLRYILQRRLRLLTVPLPVASRPEQVYRNVDPDACAALLVHKVLRAVAEEGADAARVLLRDWLVVLLSCCVLSRAEEERGGPGGAIPSLHEILDMIPDPTTGDGGHLIDSLPTAVQPLPRLVYALLRSPLVKEPHEAAAADLRAYMVSLWTHLSSEEVSRAIYPCLSSFMDPDTPAFPRHTLSRAALITSGCPIFLLDAYDRLIVYYSAACPQEIPFPPPATSLLRKTVQFLRASRRITPSVAFVRPGHPAGAEAAAEFEAALLEEPTVADEFEKEPGYFEFIDDVLLETRAHLKDTYRPDRHESEH